MTEGELEPHPLDTEKQAPEQLWLWIPFSLGCHEHKLFA